MLIRPPELAPGQREVAILVDAETGVAGKIGPNSIVDIVGTFEGNDQRGIRPYSAVVVPGARIIDVGQPKLEGGRGVERQAEADPKQVVPVTFALTPKQQLRVTYAESFAQETRLALLRPGETTPLKKNEQTYTLPELR
jgi:pilus assembly protein CpaB